MRSCEDMVVRRDEVPRGDTWSFHALGELW